MSIVSIVEKAFAGLVALLKLEAAKHAKAADHHGNKAYNHRVSENQALAKIKEAGAIYRTSLYAKADAHDQHADKAKALAAKIENVLQ